MTPKIENEVGLMSESSCFCKKKKKGRKMVMAPRKLHKGERNVTFTFYHRTDRTTCAELVFGSISGMYG